MIDNISQHIASKPLLVILIIISALVITSSIPYFMRQKNTYGDPFRFASKPRKNGSFIAAALLSITCLYLISPYTPAPSNEIAVVLGNTSNTPAPSIAGDVAEAIESTMISHKGADADTILESIRFISATKKPKTVDLGSSDIEIISIRNNNSNAKQDAKANVELIQSSVNQLKPASSGANYLEAILEAKDNVEKGSRIIVIGSGLSDSGLLNFSKTSLLTNQEIREDTIDRIHDEYGSSRLDGYTVEFYGLGDTVAPQEPLSSIQKEIVRDTYRDIVSKLGGESHFSTKTITGEAVTTDYLVGTTDTGCGVINLVFDDEDLKFISDTATFIDEPAALNSLSSISDLWNRQRDVIESIQIDGYTAHYPGADTLSQERSDAVKATLTDLGVDNSKMVATGKGFGPYDNDAHNRTVNVTITRDDSQCAI